VLSLADFPATDWSAALYLRGPAVIDLTAEADGKQHIFEADAATTAAWAAGQYWFSVRMSKDSDVVEVAKGELRVLPDLTSAEAGYDGRTMNEIALASIDAVLAKRATQDQQKYVINNRELWRTPIADLIKLRSFYSAAVTREKNRASGRTGFGRAIHVRFSNK
jgi:hypothetical protein